MKDLHDHIIKYHRINCDIDEFDAKQKSTLNETYQDLFDKAQLQHEKELRNIDKSHGVALLREAAREVPEQLELLEEAKSAAVAGRYQEAKDFYCFVDATAHFGSTN